MENSLQCARYEFSPTWQSTGHNWKLLHLSGACFLSKPVYGCCHSPQTSAFLSENQRGEMKTNSRMSTGCCLWTSENLTGICGTVVSFFKEYTLQLNEHSHWIKLLICSWTFHHSYSAVFLSRFYHCVTYYSILFTTCPSNYTVPSTTSEVILFSRIYSKPLLAH